MKFSKSITFIETRNPILKPVTKFGGQPVWVDKPQWPASAETGNLMRFICQINLTDGQFQSALGKVAYIFMTEEEEYVDGTWEPDGGENTVVIQSVQAGMTTEEAISGPTIVQYVKVEGEKLLQAEPKEYEVRLLKKEEPAYASEQERASWTESVFDDYAKKLEGNKIGGSPIFLQGEEFPSDDEYRLLMQLDSTDVPFSINFGDAGIGYAFINQDCTVGKFLWQCA